METKVLNYRIIIEPDKRTGTGEPCFTAYCPTIDVASDGDTLAEARRNIKEAIQCRVEALVADGEPVPPQDSTGKKVVIEATKVEVPKNYPLAFS